MSFSELGSGKFHSQRQALTILFFLCFHSFLKCLSKFIRGQHYSVSKMSRSVQDEAKCAWYLPSFKCIGQARSRHFHILKCVILSCYFSDKGSKVYTRVCVHFIQCHLPQAWGACTLIYCSDIKNPVFICIPHCLSGCNNDQDP